MEVIKFSVKIMHFQCFGDSEKLVQFKFIEKKKEEMLQSKLQQSALNKESAVTVEIIESRISRVGRDTRIIESNS